MDVLGRPKKQFGPSTKTLASRGSRLAPARTDPISRCCDGRRRYYLGHRLAPGRMVEHLVGQTRGRSIDSTPRLIMALHSFCTFL